MENENGRDRELTVAESFELLDQLVSRLENEDTGLEESFRLYQDGMKILKDVSEKIDTYEKKMIILNDHGTAGEFQ